MIDRLLHTLSVAVEHHVELWQLLVTLIVSVVLVIGLLEGVWVGPRILGRRRVLRRYEYWRCERRLQRLVQHQPRAGTPYFRGRYDDVA